MNKKILIIIVALLLGTAVFSYRVRIKNFYYNLKKSNLPETVTRTGWQEISGGESIFIEEINKEVKNEPIAEIQEEINLAVPFTPQAPEADWSLPYKEACEEASILMAIYYLQNKELDTQIAKDEIYRMVNWQEINWGGHFDLTIQETAMLVQEHYSDFATIIIPDLTTDKIKYYLNQGYPVVVPAAGRELGNPFFRNPGPLYHMLLIKGYTDGKFITNDPGTKRGEDYVYDFEVLMAAIHDWDGQEPSGVKVGLVITD